LSASPAAASSTFNRSAPASIKATSAAYFAASAATPIHRRGILSRCAAQREQPLLDALQFRRIEIRCDQRPRWRCWSASSSALIAAIDRLHHRGFDQGRGIGGAAFQPAHCGRQRRQPANGLPLTASCASRRSAAIFSALHQSAVRALGQRGFLAVLGLELLQFIGGMAQINPPRAPRAPCPRGARPAPHARRGAPPTTLRVRRTSFSRPAKASSSRRWVAASNQGALVMLAVDFHQRGADGLQGLHADGLVR